MIAGGRAAIVLASVAFAAVLGGCTGPVTEPTDTSSPSTTPLPVDELPEGLPAVLPFACTEVFDPELWERAFASPIPSPPDSPGVWAEAASRARGSAWCGWYRGEPYAQVGYTVSLEGSAFLRELPDTWNGQLGPAMSDVQCAEQPMGYGGCSAVAVVGGYVLDAYIGGAAWPTLAEATIMVRDLLAPTVAALQAGVAPSAWTLPGGPATVDCAAVDQLADVPGVAGTPGMVVTDITGASEDSTTPREVTAGVGMTTCRWRAPDVEAEVPIVYADVDVLVGGGWLWRDLIPRAAPGVIDAAEIAGADEAAFECSSGERCSLLMRFGPDTVQISGSQEWTYGGVALRRDQLEALGTELAPAIRSVLG